MKEIKVGTAVSNGTGVTRGTLRTVDRPDGAPVEIPVVIVRGAGDGPTLWLHGCVHGNEYCGTYIIHECLRSLDPDAMAGAVVALPILNLDAFRHNQRMSPFEGYGGGDLNKPAILRCIRNGVRSIEHGMHFDEECAEAAREHGTYLVPTLTVMDRILVFGAQAGIAEFMIENVKQRTSKHHEYVKYAHDIGANIASGTDAGSLLTPHGSAGREVVQLVRCGLTPLQAIEVATRNTARLLMAENDVGTVEAGKLADVIVVEGDVAGDVSRLEASGNMRHVLIGGREVASQGTVVAH